MKYKERTLNTSNSSAYNKLLMRELEAAENKCRFCGPHSGCNGGRGRYQPSRSWKRYRKTQWKPIE